MLYPQNIEEKLGFDNIRLIIRELCLSSLGQSYVDKIRFGNDLALITRMCDQVNEFKKIIEEERLFPVRNYIDANPFFDRIRPESSFLDPEQFKDLKLSLHTIFVCLEFFDSASDDEFPALKELRKNVEVDTKIYKRIDETVDDKGNVRDYASDDLKEIRQLLISEQSRARKELERMMKYLKREGFTDSELEITVRNGRLVLPVLAEHKRKIKGFIHDESATGQTVFLEPAEVLEINNFIKELEYQEKREIVKILTILSDYVRPYIPELKKAYTFLGLIDFVRAKAKFAIQTESIRPEIQKYCIADFKKAKHPLLHLSLQKQGKRVVPLDIKLDQQSRILVISGPNAGGKSVCLKTVGLIQYMFQCGLLIPVQEGSVAGIFQDIFIDIGDEQSIENDLSTYSSHLKNMKYFIEHAGSKSLILIDEFGTGTEPHYGAAIAEAVFEKLNANKVYGVVNTHYQNLKVFAENTPGVVNGAMRFDLNKLEPLYELETGRPGSSFALEIATKIGLPKEVLDQSREKMGNNQIDFEKLIREMEKEKIKYRQLKDKAAQEEAELNKTLQEYKEQKEFLETHKKRLMNDAKQEARNLIQETNQKIENTIRGIKEHQADKVKTKTIRDELENFSEQLTPEPVTEETPKKMEIEPGEITEGSYIRVKESGAIGEVISIKGKDAEIMIGALKSTVKLSRLEKISRKEYRQVSGETNTSSTKMIDMVEKMKAFTTRLDLRGMRGEEAIEKVERAMDDALLLSAGELYIVHGKGDGILRSLIRSRLKQYPQIKSMEDEHADRGGAGVTIVRLK